MNKYYSIINISYLFVNKINGDIKERNVSKYFTLVPTDETKDTLIGMEN